METMAHVIDQPRRAYRDTDDKFLGGVASGLAVHLGLQTLHVRIAFLLLALLGGFGVVVYAGLWILLPAGPPELEPGTPGLDAATRRGLRTARSRSRTSDVAVALSMAVVGIGAVIFLQNAGWWFSPRVFWPIVVALAGLALLWWQSDNRTGWITTGGWKAWLRLILGVILLISAVFVALFQAGVSDSLIPVLGVVVLTVIGAGLVLGPWLLRLSQDLRRERQERVRSQERADMAAHLHDSVLQTLALIQRQAGDPVVVTQLARTQERELRTWLFDAPDPERLTLKSALQAAAAEVEDALRVPIEVVSVGDIDVDDCVRPVVAAAREAMVNAARHSGAGRVDVFAEVADRTIEVFVRDRGRGFVLADVPGDRQGVRGSILDRMHRHGGEAEIRSAPDEGTEVRLAVQLPASAGEGNS
jgi:signal transduction histidine kinase/phage shock protein PspC (stress-responsive transcriptional regulator)